MFDAQTMTLQGTGSANPSTVFYSPWFPRGGDYGLFTLEVAKMGEASANLTLSIDLAQKNASDTGNGTDMSLTGFSVAGNATGTTLRVTKDVTAGFKELVRYKFTLAWNGTLATTTTAWATFRMLSPVWYDKV